MFDSFLNTPLYLPLNFYILKSINKRGEGVPLLPIPIAILFNELVTFALKYWEIDFMFHNLGSDKKETVNRGLHRIIS